MGIDNDVMQRPNLDFKKLEEYLQKNLELTEDEARVIHFVHELYLQNKSEK